MNRQTMLGVYLLLLMFIGGLWLIVAPFVMKAQAVGAAWSAGTINDVAAGGVLVFASLGGACIILGLALRDLIRAARVRPAQPAGEQAS